MFSALLKRIERQTFDKTQELSGPLEVVWIGERCGIYDNSSETLVLGIECIEISRQYFPYCRVVKSSGETGLFDILSKKVDWRQNET